MAKANIGDRTSIECVYPRDAYARDSAQNDRPGSEMLRGVRIASAPDENGEFEMAPAVRHVAEPADSTFLAPYRTGGSSAPAGYETFLGDIIAAARCDRYVPAKSPGMGDPRIRGARQ